MNREKREEQSAKERRVPSVVTVNPSKDELRGRFDNYVRPLVRVKVRIRARERVSVRVGKGKEGKGKENGKGRERGR